MTRFARAKGSKASNERVFEEATSWQEMKSQLVEKKNEIEEDRNRKVAEAKRNSNYQKFLKEKEEKQASQVEWAEFPTQNKISEKSKNISKKNKNTMNVVKNVSPTLENGTDSGVDTVSNPGKFVKIKKKKVAKLGQQNGFKESDDEAPTEASSKVEVLLPKVTKAKGKQKKLKIVLHEEAKAEQTKNDEKCNGKKINDAVVSKPKKKKQKLATNVENKNQETKGKQNKIKAKKSEPKEPKPKVDIESLSEVDKKKVLKKQEKRRKQMEKKKLKKQQNKEAENQNNEKTETGTATIPQETKNSKPSDKKSTKFERNENSKPQPKDKTPVKKIKSKNAEFKRRKDFKPNQMIINGNAVDLEYFDGFPIKKEDAENLKQLKKEMVIKGLPRSEINRTLKLERRKAEKSLTREKKKVCFNCRKFGHNLSECPELSSNKELVDTSGTGICFKCGSTEHTSFVCKVVQGESFKFATCFICKEQGHISRQCPDNARGLYPKGGSCKVCGDVTHLKKDCPQFHVQQEKEQQKFQIERFGSGNLEDLDGGNETTVERVVKQNKVIKF